MSSAANSVRVRIVLVESSHPGNIGAAARAMKTMGLTQLWLVRPQHFPHADATARASGADDVLAAARVCAGLDEALHDCRLVLATTARTRSLRWPVWSPREAAAQLLAHDTEGDGALVFGGERSGLSNRDLERCHGAVCIPANPGFSSLNLAAAVQILSYEIHLAGGAAAPAAGREPLAPNGDLERFYAALRRVLIDLDFLDPRNPRQLMRRLRRLFGRARLTAVELNILRGILTAIERRR